MYGTHWHQRQLRRSELHTIGQLLYVEFKSNFWRYLQFCVFVYSIINVAKHADKIQHTSNAGDVSAHLLRLSSTSVQVCLLTCRPGTEGPRTKIARIHRCVITVSSKCWLWDIALHAPWTGTKPQNSCSTIYHRNVVCFRYIVGNTLHKIDKSNNSAFLRVDSAFQYSFTKQGKKIESGTVHTAQLDRGNRIQWNYTSELNWGRKKYVLYLM
jgi:hypothetical protein